MANSRYYSSVALPTSLTAGITNSATSIQVASTAGFPGSLPYTLAIDYGQVNEELVEVTGVAALTLTVTRAIDSTSASSHNAGAVVRHVSSARDFTDSRTHEASTANVHGVTGVGNDLVGTTSTQTLSNKTLNFATGTLRNVDIYNVSWITAVIGDSANPSSTKFHVLDNEISLNEIFAVTGNGAVYSFKGVGEADNLYRFRVTDSNHTTDRWAVLAGGTMTLTPTSTTTFTPVDIVAPDTSTTKRAIRVAASGGGTERFTVWNDGRVDIKGTAPAFSQLDVLAAPSQSTTIFRVLDSASTIAYLNVGATGRVDARVGLDIEAVDSAATIPLQIFANQPGPQTGNLTQWVNSSNVICASVDADGDFSAKSVTSASTISASGNISTSAGSVSGVAGTFTGLVTAADFTASTTAAVTTSGLTVQSGWTVNTFSSRTSAGVTFVTCDINRSGATFTPANTTGNVTPDLLIANVPANSRPPVDLYISCSTAVGDGTLRLEAGGDVYLVTWVQDPATIANNANLRWTYTYIS